MNVANCLFLLATILAALSQSTALFITARALTGLAVASNVLNPAIVGDMFPSDQRGSPMSLVMLAPLLGGAVGPAIAGAVAQTVGWRQVVWMSAGLAAVCEVLFLTCFRETYKVPILRNRAAKLRAATHDDSLKAPFDEGEHRSLLKLWESVMRPAIVVCSSGVLLSLSLFGSVAFAFYYVMATSLPDVLEGLYNLTPAAAGLSFMSFSKYTCPVGPCAPVP
jgi:MFS family permease